MQQAQERNGQAGLILLLMVMVGFAVYQVVIAPMLNKEEGPAVSNEQGETEEERIQRIGHELYQVFFLSADEESVLTTQDKAYLNERLSLQNMSPDMKIYYAIKNLDHKYLMSDSSWSLKEAVKNSNGNYYYDGHYILEDAVIDSLKKTFGEDVPIAYKTVTLNNVRYVYNADAKRYERWTVMNEQTTTVKKVTYIEIVNNQDELYIYEYVAYTDYADPQNLKTTTTHTGSLDVVITEENAYDYLNYMDKYRYTFAKQEDGSYVLLDIQYEQE